MLISAPLRYITITVALSIVTTVVMLLTSDVVIFNYVIVLSIITLDFIIIGLYRAVWEILVTDFNWELFMKEKRISPFLAVLFLFIILTSIFIAINTYGYLVSLSLIRNPVPFAS